MYYYISNGCITYTHIIRKASFSSWIYRRQVHSYTHCSYLLSKGRKWEIPKCVVWRLLWNEALNRFVFVISLLCVKSSEEEDLGKDTIIIIPTKRTHQHLPLSPHSLWTKTKWQFQWEKLYFLPTREKGMNCCGR